MIQPGNDSLAAEDHAVLEAILNTAVDAIVTIDERGIMRRVNAAACRMFGYNHAELLGRNVSLLMPAPDREQHDGYVRSYLETGVARIIGIGREVMAQRRDGTTFFAEISISEVNSAGRHLFTGIIRDTTERHEAEASLRRERAFANDLIETGNAVIVVLDLQGRVLRINSFTEQITGYRREEILGKDWFETLVVAEDRAESQRVFQSVLSGRPAHGYVNRLLGKSGERRTITWSGRRLVDRDEFRDGVLGIGNDVTDLENAKQKAIQSERLAAIGQMVAGLAHESRNALQRSRAFLDMLELDVGRNDEQRLLVRGVQDALSELQRLYEEVRNYAAPLRLELIDCRLRDLCQETWDNLEDRHESHRVRFRLECTEPYPRCRCDAQRIQQVVRNILENALAVSPDGGQIAVSCEETQLRGLPAVRLRIRDDGPGLSEEQSARIFEPFFTTKTKGTGLGMAIAKRIVEAHGGEIAIGSPPVGAEIVVTLPCDAGV